MGSGGVSGAVEFPDYVMDVHGDLIAGSVTNNEGDFSETFDRFDKSVVQLLNTAFNTNPWTTLTLSSPSAHYNEVGTQFDTYVSAVTGYDVANMSSYVTQALLAVTGASAAMGTLSGSAPTKDVGTPESLFLSHVSTLISKLPALIIAANSTGTNQTNLEQLVTSASSAAQAQASFTAATTAWNGIITKANTVLRSADLPREVNILPLLQKAASDAEENLKAALQVVERYLSSPAVQRIVDQFAQRRETQFQQQLGQFAGTMSDINAVNSSAFLFGSALLRTEQMREVSEFDTQINLEMLQQGFAQYIQTHIADLRAGVEAEIANSRHHTAILNASLDLMGTLQDRGEVKPSDLMSLYGNMFQSEVGNNTQVIDYALQHMGFMRKDNVDDSRQRELKNSELSLQAEQINKEVKERRYLQGLAQTSNILQNRVEFERAAMALQLEYRQRRAAAINVHEEKENQLTLGTALWNFTSARRAADILAAPAGMSGTLDGTPSIGREIASVGIQTVANVASAGAAGG